MTPDGSHGCPVARLKAGYYLSVVPKMSCHRQEQSTPGSMVTLSSLNAPALPAWAEPEQRRVANVELQQNSRSAAGFWFELSN